MLNDAHLKVVMFEQDSSKVFPTTDIKGGVVVILRDKNKSFGAIETFTPYPELNMLLQSMKRYGEYETLPSIMYSQCAYGISNTFHNELPDESARLKPSAKKFFASNVFDNLTNKVFFDVKPADGEEYIQLYGRQNNARVYKWIKRKYVVDGGNLDYYKVMLPNSNGSGAVGEMLSTPVIGHPVIGHPVIGHTQTFISVGKFTTLIEAEACLKYIKTKFVRALLGILKITQHNTPEKWAYVPLQDFTEQSDIDWSKSIAEIDQQLYNKYGLTKKEIDFIEKKVKSMDDEVVEEENSNEENN